MYKKFTLYILLITSLLFFTQCRQEKSSTVQTDVSKSAPTWSKDVTMYEVNIRQFTEEGTFEAFSKHLPRLKKLGVGIIWLMPIHQIGELNRKEPLGSYYSVKDYKSINHEFGTAEDFQNLVKKVHENGMHIIIDWVANHTSWDNVWVKTNPEFYVKDSKGNFIPPVPDWSDVIKLDYNNVEMRAKMLDALKYWVSEFDIDGYRCDVAGDVPTDFWNNARTELDKIKPVFMLAESEKQELLDSAFDIDYAWEVHKYINDVAQNNANANDLFNVYLKRRDEYGVETMKLNFTSNHDENSWNGTVQERLGDASEVMAALTFAIEGMPLIYNGQEAGLNKRLKFFERDAIEWKDSKFNDIYEKLVNAKKDNPALWNGKFGGKLVRIKTSNQENCLSFVREKDGNKVVFISNLSDKTIEVKLADDKFNGSFKNVMNNEDFNLKGSSTITLAPWEYFLLVSKK